MLDSGRFILGPEGAAFEEEFSRTQGVPHCLGVSSGTDALMLALEACGVGPGDEVIVPTFSFIATATVVSVLGAKPVFADVEESSLTLDPASVLEVRGRRSKALLPVHLYGVPADLDGLLEIARKYGLRLIEDAAQAHLTRYKGRPAGGIGDAGCFSFYPSKNLGAFGDAGLLSTPDPKVFAACAMLRDAGRKPGKRYEHARVGHNARLDELQAALLRVKLARLASWTRERRRVAERYRRGLAGLPVGLPPQESEGSRHSHHLFVIRTKERDALAKHLSGAGIETAVYYPAPLHLQPAYAGHGHRRGDFPVAEKAAREVLALPIFPELPDASVDLVCASIRDFFSAR